MVGTKVCLVWHSLVSVVSGWVWPSSFVHVQPDSSRLGKKSIVTPTLFYDTSILARPIVSSGDVVDESFPYSSDNNDGLLEKMPTTEKAIDLQTHTDRKPPTDTLTSLSEACKRFGVDAFDVYGDFGILDTKQSYLREFEAEVATHFGKGDGVFCMSGGMAQSIALLINNARKNHRSSSSSSSSAVRGGGHNSGEDRTISAFACHPTSHLVLHENNAFSELLGMEAVVVGPDSCSTKGDEVNYDPQALKDNGCYGMEPIRLSHLKELFSSLDDGSSSRIPPTYPNLKQVSSIDDISTLILELPHREVGGKLTPWEEVEEIARMCNEHGIYYHCDGARIFEASAGYGHKSVKQTAHPFESVYVSFYKGLGAISGAMLLGDSEFCAEARVWLRRMGGNMYTVLPYAISSWDGFRKNCLTEEEVYINGEEGYDGSVAKSLKYKLVYDNGVFENRRKKLTRVLELLRADEKINSIVQFDPVVPETNIVHGYLRMSYDECMAALEKVELSTGIRVLSRVRSNNNGISRESSSCGDARIQNFGCRFEWTMGESNSLIEDGRFLLGWNKFAQVGSEGE
mmetsp:Transcript_21114/g.33143  ORF Transcript_21114/g.33143 Transcript_21114/m.33143 type:complete len:571 (-) Transcript_21114:146-1858(-)